MKFKMLPAAIFQAVLLLAVAQIINARHRPVDTAELAQGASINLHTRQADSALEDFLDGCGHGHLMAVKKTHKFTTPNFDVAGKDYHGSLNCEWTFVGDETCTNEIICSKLDLKASDECSDEYLQVSDGVGGVERFCGDKSFTEALKPTKGMRDLYVKFKSSPAGGEGRKGFFCEVRCSANPGSTKELAVNHQKKEDARCVCGLQNKDDRIVGGVDAKMNEFPWQAAVVFTGTRSPKCGAAIINNKYALCAAHCFWFDKSKPGDIEVLFHARSLDMTLQGGWKDVELGQKGSIRGSGYKDKQLKDADEKTQRFKVVQIINHPMFTPKYDYDVALLKLEPIIDLAHPDAPTPICLPELGYSEKYLGQIPWVVGWGMPDENAGGTTRALQKLDVPIIPIEKCQSWVPYDLTPRMICAGYEEGKRDACTGDSGGPLSLLNPSKKQWEQIGIVSWGEGCAQAKKPGFYSRVTDLNQWIHYHTSDATFCKRHM